MNTTILFSQEVDINPLSISASQSDGQFSDAMIPPNLESSIYFPNSSGAYVRQEVDLKIPGRAGMDLVISRTYDSSKFRSIPSVLLHDKYGGGLSVDLDFYSIERGLYANGKYGANVPKNYSSWIGSGWDLNVGAALYSLKLESTNVDKSYHLFVQLPSQTYVFTKDSFEDDYVNVVKGSTAVIIEESQHYILQLSDGSSYTFDRTVQPIGKYTEAKLIQDHNHNNIFTTTVNTHKLRGFNLIKITNKFGDSISFNYERVENIGDGDTKTLKGNPHFVLDDDFNVINDQYGDPLIVEDEVSLFFNESGRPSRLSSIEDSFGRKVVFEYRAPLEYSDEGRDYSSKVRNNYKLFSEASVQISQIDTISFKGVNGTTENISYEYNLDDQLEKVVYPSGQTVSYEYSEPTTGKSGFLLDKITTKEGLLIDLDFVWHESDKNKYSRHILDTLQFSQGALSDSLLWSYSFQEPSKFSIYKDYSGANTYSFKTVTLVAPEGTYTKKYDKGLLTSDSRPLGKTISQEWDYDLRQLTKVTESLGDQQKTTEYTSYDDYGNPKEILEYAASKSDKHIKRTITYLHESDSTIKSKHILDVIESEAIEAQNSSKKLSYTYDFDSGSYLPNSKTTTYSDLSDDFYGSKSHIENYLSYDNGNVTSYQKPEGQHISYDYDHGLYLSKTTYDDVSISVESSFDKYTGLVESETGFNETKSYTYYNDGRLQKIDYNSGTTDNATESYVYDNANRKTTITTMHGDTIERTVDGLGRLTLEEKKDANFNVYEKTVISYAYSGNDLLKTESVTRKGTTRTTIYTYDALNRLISVQSPDENNSSISYTVAADGLLKKTVTNANSNATKYYYDDFGQLRKITDAKDNDVTFDYDDFGYMTESVDLSGKVTTYYHYPTGKLKKRNSPYQNAQTTKYDDNGNIYRDSIGDSRETYFTYDSLGNASTLKNYCCPSEGDEISYKFEEEYKYHNANRNANNKLWKVDRKTWRLVRPNPYSTKDQFEAKTYTAEYAYDRFGRVITIDYTYMDGNEYQILYSYNLLGQVTSITDPVGTTTYAYNADHSLNTISRGAFEVAKYDYDTGDFTLPSRIKFNNQTITVELDYAKRSQSNWIKKIEASVNGSHLFTYDITSFDAMGNRKQLSYSSGGQRSDISYDYDSLNQLTKVTYPHSKSLSYSYDKSGNRNAYKSPLRRVSYSQSNGRIDGYSMEGLDVALTYDKLGNLSQKSLSTSGDEDYARITYDYDGRNNLLRIDSSPKVNSVTHRLMHYDYDHQNRLILSTKAEGAYPFLGESYETIWGLGDDAIAKTNTDKDIVSVFIFSPSGQRLAELKVDSENPSYNFFINDASGTPIHVLNSDNDVVYQHVIDPFGDIRFHNGDMQSNSLTANMRSSFKFPYMKLKDLNITANTQIEGQDKLLNVVSATVKDGAELLILSDTNAHLGKISREGSGKFRALGVEKDTSTRYRLSGKEYYDEHSLYYYTARWYDPHTGRFMSVDPAAPDTSQPLSFNPYHFVYNNPNAYIDPDGRNPALAARAAIAARGAWIYLRSPAFQQKMANATVSFSNAYSTTMATGGNRWDALQSGGMAFGSSLFLNAPTTMSGAMMHQARVNVLTQTHSIWRDPNLTYTDFSMSSLGYNTLTGGTLSYGLSALNISGRVGGITGVMAEAPFDFGMGASFSGLGMAFESGGKYSYTIGNMLPIDPAPSFNYSLSNDYGFDAAWNDYMYGGF